MSTKAVEDGASERERPSVPAKTSLSIDDLATRCEDTRTAALSLSMLNVGYPSSSLNELEEGCGGGRGGSEEEEKGTLAPETPQRAARPNPGEGNKEKED